MNESLQPESEVSRSVPGQMRILLHICCSPCLCGPLNLFHREGIDVEGFFYNPNIHLFVEFRRRLKSVKVLAEREKLPLICDEEYGLKEFLRSVNDNHPERCESCYKMRLVRTAREAKDRGYDAFSTTLLASPSQQHDILRNVGKTVANDTGIEWYYRDMRKEYESGMKQAKQISLYRQQYCGCLWSEYERYRETNIHAYRGGSEL